jgi:adenosyl cobinamide kinase/adenosyl cobinamide phosphate guanylyltransferase
MSKTITELHERVQKAQAAGDKDTAEFLLTLASKLEDADMVRHHFGYFVMHAQAIVPHNAQPRHFRDALARAKRILADTAD